MREGILRRDRFSANPTEMGRYSPALAQNTPVFRRVGPEIGSIALSAGQNGEKFRLNYAYHGGEKPAFDPKQTSFAS